MCAPGVTSRQQEVKRPITNLNVILRVQLYSSCRLPVNGRVQRALHTHAILPYHRQLPHACKKADISLGHMKIAGT